MPSRMASPPIYWRTDILSEGIGVGGLGDALGQDDVRKDALALDVVRGERRIDLGGALALSTSSQGRRSE